MHMWCDAMSVFWVSLLRLQSGIVRWFCTAVCAVYSASSESNNLWIWVCLCTVRSVRPDDVWRLVASVEKFFFFVFREFYFTAIATTRRRRTEAVQRTWASRERDKRGGRAIECSAAWRLDTNCFWRTTRWALYLLVGWVGFRATTLWRWTNTQPRRQRRSRDVTHRVCTKRMRPRRCDCIEMIYTT